MSSQRGSVTVLTAGVLVIALVLTLGAADLGRVLVAQARSRTAADAAALAAAQELALPTGREPAEVAREYAQANDATLTICDCEAGAYEATVEVAVDVGRLLLFPGDRSVVGHARAVVDLPSASPSPPSPPPPTPPAPT